MCAIGEAWATLHAKLPSDNRSTKTSRWDVSARKPRMAFHHLLFVVTELELIAGLLFFGCNLWKPGQRVFAVDLFEDGLR